MTNYDYALRKIEKSGIIFLLLFQKKKRANLKNNTDNNNCQSSDAVIN